MINIVNLRLLGVSLFSWMCLKIPRLQSCRTRSGTHLSMCMVALQKLDTRVSKWSFAFVAGEKAQVKGGGSTTKQGVIPGRGRVYGGAVCRAEPQRQAEEAGEEEPQSHRS